MPTVQDDIRTDSSSSDPVVVGYELYGMSTGLLRYRVQAIKPMSEPGGLEETLCRDPRFLVVRLTETTETIKHTTTHREKLESK